MKSQNWQPINTGNSKNFYTCLQQSQQTSSSAYFGANSSIASGSSNTSAVTNETLLNSCMNSKGYNLRPMTGKEKFWGFVLFPLAIPLSLVSDDLRW